jgi:hypothetical protein
MPNISIEDTGVMRTFESGATRDTGMSKPDYEGFLSPEVLVAFGEYMLSHQRQSDGSLRESDNWQKGIPLNVYMKSLFRHVVDLWRMHRNPDVEIFDKGKQVTMESLLCAVMFNVMGYLHEYLKGNRPE